MRVKSTVSRVSLKWDEKAKAVPPWFRLVITVCFPIIILGLFLLGRETIYAAATLPVMYLVVAKWRSRKLGTERQTLEQIIKEKTSVINDQKQRLKEQAEKLKEMDKVICNLPSNALKFTPPTPDEAVDFPAKIPASPMDRAFIKELKEVLNENISNPEFCVEGLSKQLYMSHATLYRKIHTITGESPRDFIRSYRLKRGVELLKDGFGNVSDVAFEVGFSSTSYFTKCFKKKFNQLPSHYLKPNQSKA